LLVGTNGIYDGDLKFILRLIFALILHYDVANRNGKSLEEQKSLMLKWINTILPSCNITNFTTDWNDGIFLSALVNYCKPGLIPGHASMDPSKCLENVTNAMNQAERELGVPQVIQPEDLATDKPDGHLVVTYLSGFRCPGSTIQKGLPAIPPKPALTFTLKAVGPGISGDVAGTETNFVVSGPHIPKWAKINAVVKSSDGTVFPIKKHMVDTKAVQFHYTPEEPGDYAVHVTVNGEPIPDSAFDVTHKAKFSKLRLGVGVLQMEGIAPSVSAVSVKVQGPNGPVPFNMEPEDNSGVYNVHYLPTCPGWYLLHVFMDGQSIPNCPIIMYYDKAQVDSMLATSETTSAHNMVQRAHIFPCCGPPSTCQPHSTEVLAQLKYEASTGLLRKSYSEVLYHRRYVRYCFTFYMKVQAFTYKGLPDLCFQLKTTEILSSLGATMHICDCKCG
jgi:hypothetical protein